MTTDALKNLSIIIVLTLLSGIGDANGFSHAANMWNKGRIVFPEFVQSILGFSFGIGTYMISVKYFQRFGVVSPEMQTIGWIVVTTIGVAIIGGKFPHWQIFDQILSIAIIVGLCILVLRTNG